MSYTKIKRYRQLNSWRMEITTCTGNFFSHAKQHYLKMDPSARKLQESRKNGIKSKEINRTFKLCTLATNDLILS